MQSQVEELGCGVLRSSARMAAAVHVGLSPTDAVASSGGPLWSSKPCLHHSQYVSPLLRARRHGWCQGWHTCFSLYCRLASVSTQLLPLLLSWQVVRTRRVECLGMLCPKLSPSLLSRVLLRHCLGVCHQSDGDCELQMGRNSCSFQGSLDQVVGSSVAGVTASAVVTTETGAPRLSTLDPQCMH